MILFIVFHPPSMPSSATLLHLHPLMHRFLEQYSHQTSFTSRRDPSLSLFLPECIKKPQSCQKVVKPTSNDALYVVSLPRIPNTPIYQYYSTYQVLLHTTVSSLTTNETASLLLFSVFLQALLQVRQAIMYCRHMVPRQLLYWH